LIFETQLNSSFARASVLLFTITACGLLLTAIAFSFIISALTDYRSPASLDALALAAGYFPDSPRLNARLSEAELSVADEREAAVRRADQHAARAVAASPFEYRFRLLQASARESLGDRAGAEAALREAVRLAPMFPDVRWRLANLLLRSGKPAEAADQFQVAVLARPALLPGAFELLWNFSRGDVGLIERMAGQGIQANLSLANFLLKKGRAEEAVRIFAQTKSGSRLADSTAATQSSTFINALIAAGRIDDARRAWLETLKITGDQLLSDGGFEQNIPSGFEQFAWQIGATDHARIRITDDQAAARNGQKSLRIEFTGRNSTTLDQEIRHPMLVSPGATYRVECYVRTKNLITPEGPRIAVMNGATVIAESAPVAAGTNEWQRLEFDFTAPKNARLLQVTLRRTPKFGYDDPTRGALWLDDFSVTLFREVGSRESEFGSGREKSGFFLPSSDSRIPTPEFRLSG
jgi:tetratricopeptide (TPR) repeat protein